MHEIDQDLTAAERTLAHWAKNYPELARTAATAKAEYELAYEGAYDEIANRAVPEGKKPLSVDAIKAKATLQCEKQLREHSRAEVELKIASKLIGIAETTLTSIQTRAGLEKIDAGLSAYR